MLEVLVQRFESVNKRKPSHVNELLDYVQKCYIQGELTITEYKGYFSELDKQNAEKPEAYIIKNALYGSFNIPG